MNVLWLTHYFPPEVGAPQTRIFELARGLVRRGHRVTVLTGFPNYPDGIITEPYAGRLFQREEMEGINVVRSWVYATPNKGFVKRLVNHLSLTVTAVPASLVIRDVDVIVIESPPLFLGIAGYLISRMKRVTYLLYVADLWPGAAVALGALKNPTLISLSEALERFLYGHAARVITVTRGLRRAIIEKGMPETRVALLTNGVDTKRFHPAVDPAPAVERLGLDDRLTVAYAGTHGMAHGLEVVVEAARLLRDEPGIRFVMVGEGAEKAALVRKAAGYGLENLHFFPNQPRTFMPHLWAAADIAVVPLRGVDLFRSTLPAKLFEIMAMECPVVLAADGEARELVLEAGAGLAVKPENPEEIAAAILQLAGDAAARQSYGRNGRRYVQAQFERERLIDQLEAILDSAR